MMASQSAAVNARQVLALPGWQPNRRAAARRCAAACGLDPAQRHPARTAPKAPGERLPVRAGWRFGQARAPLMGRMYMAGIKHAVPPVQRHPTGRRSPGLRFDDISALLSTRSHAARVASDAVASCAAILTQRSVIGYLVAGGEP